MDSAGSCPPDVDTLMDRKLDIGVIGLGERASSLVEVFRRVYPTFRLAAVADPDEAGARQRLARRGVNDQSPRFFSNADRMLGNIDGLDGILIGTRCNLHTPMAVKAAGTGLPLYLEKPVATSYPQIVELRDAYKGRESSVVVSFPMRSTPLFGAVMKVVDSGRLGTINQMQTVNNVPYGAEYFGSPTYREHDVTGGLWLQKATHDFDYINQVLGRPTMISAMMSRKAFGGDMPHDLWCSQCEIAGTCMESPQGLQRRGHELVKLGDHLCVFGDGLMHQDAGSAMVMYESGAHAAYSQNFVSSHSAVTRGATITGYEATVTFDWYTEQVRVIDHMTDRVDEMTIRATTGHLGGDEVLVRNFADVCLGRDEAHSDLSSGLLSASMCLTARESAHQQRWLPVADVYSPQYPEAPAGAHPTPANIEPP